MGRERLKAALEDRILAGAPGALARARCGVVCSVSAGGLARGEGRSVGPEDAFRVASVTKSLTATVAVRLPRVRREPGRAWDPVEFVDHVAGHGRPHFAPGDGFRYSDTGYVVVVEGVELVGHTGFTGAFAFYAPDEDAVLVGTHNQSQVDRWPLVGALCRELRSAS